MHEVFRIHTVTTKENLRKKFGIIQEFLVIFIFHEKELPRNYLGIPIPIWFLSLENKVSIRYKSIPQLFRRYSFLRFGSKVTNKKWSFWTFPNHKNMIKISGRSPEKKTGWVYISQENWSSNSRRV